MCGNFIVLRIHIRRQVGISCAFLHSPLLATLLSSAFHPSLKMGEGVSIKLECLVIVMSEEILHNLESARLAFSAGDVMRAEGLCRSILSVDEKNGAALHLMGALALHRGNVAEALVWFERAANVLGRDAALLCNQGEAYRQLGRLDEARRHLELALQQDNTSPAPHFNLAMVYRAGGSPRLAEHFFRNVLMLNPQLARAHYELAELYRAEGHAAEAELEYRAGMAALPPVPRDDFSPEITSSLPVSMWSARLGSLLREQGETLAAIEVLSVAIRNGAEDASVHLELSKCLFEMCCEDAAFQHYELARTLDSNSANSSSTCIAARVMRIGDWCRRSGAQFTLLSRAQWISFPELSVIPAAAQINFRIGRPVAAESFIATIPLARILPRQCAILTEDGCLFTDGVVNWPQFYPQSGECVLHAADDLRVMLELPEACTYIDEVCAVLGGAGDLYAWMFEALPRIWALEQQSTFRDARFIVSGDLSADRLNMLRILGISSERIVRLFDDHYLRCKELVVPSLMTVGDWISPVALQFLRRKFAGTRGGKERKIFLSRGHASNGRLKNEAELLPILEQWGYEVIDSIAVSPLDLIAVLTDAVAIIASDDETLATLVVAPQGAKVGVIIPEGVYRARAFFLSSQIGHKLTYLVAQPDFTTNALLAQCDVELPVGVLTEYLERTLQA